MLIKWFRRSSPAPLSTHLSTHPSWPLSWVLLIPFVLLISSTVGLVGYLSFWNGERAVNELSQQLRREILARINRELEAYFGTPNNINHLSATSFVQGELNWDTGQGAQQFLAQLRLSPYIYAVYCGNSQGDFLGATRLLDGNDRVGIWQANTSTNHHLLTFTADYLGAPNLVNRDAGPYDPRKRPWYKSAVTAEQPIWSDVYVSFSQKLPTITASQPVYDPVGHHIMGVCATDVLLSDDLRSFLSDLNIGKTGQAFILNRKGELLSTSSDDPLTQGKGADQSLIRAENSYNPLVKASTQHLLERFSNLDAVDRSLQSDFTLNGQRQLLQITPFQDHYGLDLLIVVVLPESDFMAQIQSNTLWTVGLCGVALGGAVLLAAWISRRLTQPLERLSQMSQQLAQGDLDQQVQVSAIRELQVLAQSFNQMSAQLRKSFHALEVANVELEERVEERTAALRQSEERWQLAIQGSHDGIWDLDPQRNEVFYSPRCKQMLGYEDEEMDNLPSSFSSRLHPEDHERVLQAMENHLQRKTPQFRVEFRMLCKDGSYKWILSRGQALWNEKGEAIRMAGSHSDIHDRKLAEEALQRQSDRDNLLTQISQQLLEQRLDDAIHMALERLMVFCHSQYVALLTFNPSTQGFDVSHRHVHPYASLAGAVEGLQRPTIEGESLVSQALFSPPNLEDLFGDELTIHSLPWLYQQCRSGAGVSFQSRSQLPAGAKQEQQRFQEMDIEALLVVPMLHQGSIVGCMVLATFHDTYAWSEEELQLVQLVGEMLGMAQARLAAEEALMQEQEKSERLLLNVLPAPIVNRLKKNQGAIADEFEAVSILFADIVGFTDLASRLEPSELVDLLNKIFSRFDALAADRRLEKIKTIGDAYMVAAGLPLPRPDHAEAIADMALEMQRTIQSLSQSPTPNHDTQALKIRIGINTGKVVAGVIGTHKFIYDLWGDTVNISSRMESSGEPDRIQVADAAYPYLVGKYHLEPRGEIQVKGKGLMKTYWLIDRN